MRILQVSPLEESVPPKGYGGIERIVSFLTEELVRLGHDVTLVATEDSRTSAELVPLAQSGLRRDESAEDFLPHHIELIERAAELAEDFDITHFHLDYIHFPVIRARNLTSVTTCHNRLDSPDLVPIHEDFREIPLVSISNSQREPLPFVNWQATVYNGTAEHLHTLHERPGEYLAFVGRTSPEKGLHEAIDIARRSGMHLKAAAKVDERYPEYFEEEIKPHLNELDIEFVNEISDAEKDEFYGNAYATLFPISWPEPFGMVMAESMASGTPVIAYRYGSVPEVVDEGETGYIVSDAEEAVAALDTIAGIDRGRCRQIFEERFSARRMAADYVEVYRKLCNGGT